MKRTSKSFRGRGFALCSLLALAVPVGAAEHPSILLISIDTLRSDRLPAYGFTGVETPAIDAFAKDSIVFDHAYSHMPLTLPSHLTMLTGLLPGEHGVRDNTGYRFDATKHPFLPILLKKSGYATGAVVSSFVLRNETGIDAGWDHYDGNLDPGMNAGGLAASQRIGAQSAKRALEWIREHQEKPFFFFLHLYEPHSPYEPIEPFATKYADQRYLGEIATADSYLGAFLAELKQIGLYDKTMILLVSDHGEGLGDHVEAEHAIFLYRETLNVPMMVKLPGNERAGTRVGSVVQLSDVFPTVAGAAGAKVPKEVKAISLLQADKAPADRQVYSESYYPRIHYGWSHLESLVQLPFHLIHGPDPELFDLVKEPAEKTNLRESERRAFNTMRQAIQGYERPFAKPVEEDPETKAKLAALGYLSSGPAKAEGPLPDPKSQFPAIEEFREATKAIGARRLNDAIVRFEAIIAKYPGMVEAYTMLGNAYMQNGQPDKALVAFQSALKVSGGSGAIAMAAAGAFVDLGRFADARAHISLGAEANPVQASQMLSRIALAEKNLPEAEKQARAAIAAGGSRMASLVLLAQTMLQQGKIEEGLTVTDEALAQVAEVTTDDKTFRGLYIVRGDLLRKKGRNSEAVAAYKEEVLQFPDEPFAYAKLARTYNSIGRTQEARKMLKQLIAGNPSSPLNYAVAINMLQGMRMFPDSEALLREAMRKFPDDPKIRAISEKKYLGSNAAEDDF